LGDAEGEQQRAEWGGLTAMWYRQGDLGCPPVYEYVFHFIFAYQNSSECDW